MVVAVVDMDLYSKSTHFFVLSGIGRQQQVHHLVSSRNLWTPDFRNGFPVRTTHTTRILVTGYSTHRLLGHILYGDARVFPWFGHVLLPPLVLVFEIT